MNIRSLSRCRRAALIAVFGLVICAAHVRAVCSDTNPDGVSPSDWSSIRAAYDATRHAVFTVEGGYQARNPGQRWLTRFDGRGFSVQPDAGGWTWGLQLESYGFAGSEQDICESAKVSANGQRVTYDWDATLQEWWVNETRGLEHGYTVRERPTQCDAGPLTIRLAVRGDLQACVQDDGRGVRFKNVAGIEVLTYTDLLVTDADGQELPAHIDTYGATLHLTVEDRGARYPLTIDPIAQQAYIKASNTGAGDNFGYSVSVSGDTVVVGSFNEDGNATGVNGNQADNSATNAGAAYVFVRNGTSWSQQAYLKASNAGAVDFFGWSVAIAGDTLVVGAVGEASNALGVNGNQLDNSAFTAGAAYVFVRSGTTWSQQAYLKASNSEAGDSFGHSVTVAGDTVVVGALLEASGATGVNGNQADNSATGSGAAYVFVRSGTTWSQQAYLKASNAEADDNFARSVSLSGNTLVIGALYEDSGATGVNGNQADNGATDSGAAYVFVRSGTTWSQQAYLKASNTEFADGFGYSASVSGDTVVIGAPFESSNAFGINGDQASNAAFFAGAAYVFVRSGTAWIQQAYIKASNTEANDIFGWSLSVSGDVLAIGAYGEASSASGVNGNQTDNSASGSGAAYLFMRSGTTWSQQAYVKPSNTGTNDSFGYSVCVSGGTLVVGAYREDSAALGVGGNQSDNTASNAGAAYVFLDSGPAAYCFGDGSGTACPCSNPGLVGRGCNNTASSGGAGLSSSGTASISVDTLVLIGSNAVPFGPGLYYQGSASAAPGVAFGNGLRCAGGATPRLEIRPVADGSGGSSTTVPVHILGSDSAGDLRYYQLWYRDSPNFGSCTSGFNFSNAISLTWIP